MSYNQVILKSRNIGLKLMDDYTKCLFPIIKQLPTNKNAHLLDGLEQGCLAPDTKCMRFGCQEPRWVHPYKGNLVCCKEHSMEVILGHRRAPPLRRNIDYISTARKTFLVEDLSKVDTNKQR